ncbi:unnamed protein product, partial [Rotaria sp. Silwood2]
NESTSHPLFRKVKELQIEFKNNLPSHWALFISTLIDLATIVQIKFTGRSIYKARRNMRANIASLLQRTCCLTSLTIDYDSCIYNSWTAENICSMVPSHIKHLTVSIKNPDEIKLVLKRLPHLSSAQFRCGHTSSWRKFIEWFEENKAGSRCRGNAYLMSLWLDKTSVQSIEQKHSNKRIKIDGRSS